MTLILRTYPLEIYLDFEGTAIFELSTLQRSRPSDYFADELAFVFERSSCLLLPVGEAVMAIWLNYTLHGITSLYRSHSNLRIL